MGMTKTFAQTCKERAEKAPVVTCEYTECIDMYWINPWSKQKEKLCMVMWPAHPVEATKYIEDTFEAMGILWASSRTDMPELCRRLDRAIQKLREVDTQLSIGNYEVEHDGSHRRLADELEAMPEGEK